jgi:hypothetical protein
VQSPSRQAQGEREVYSATVSRGDRGYAREAATLFCESSTLWKVFFHSMEKEVFASARTILYSYL